VLVEVVIVELGQLIVIVIISMVIIKELDCKTFVILHVGHKVERIHCSL